MAGEFVVESIPVSIDQGNGSLYLLVEKRESSVQPKLRAVVLIHGEDNVLQGAGNPDSNCKLDRQPILSIFKWIEIHYDLRPQKQLRLTSIVATESNDSGIAKFIQDAAAQAKGSSAPAQIPWLKWDETGQPLTYFYSMVGNNATGDRERRFSYSAGTVAIKLESDDKTQFQYPFARHHGTPENSLLGTNFFNNAMLEIATGDVSTVTPTALVTKNPPEQGQPGMYCVAGPGVNISSISQAKNSETIAIEDSSNQHAVVMVMIWGTSPPRASHFFGGKVADGNKAVLQDWLSRDKVQQVQCIYKVIKKLKDGSRLARSIQYPSPLAQEWLLNASMNYFYGVSLTPFFPPSLREAVAPLLDRIIVERVNVTYNYKKLDQQPAKASSFRIDGVLLIGQYRFTLDFMHNGTDWTFNAKMDHKENEGVASTAGEMIRDIAGDLGLPDFLVNIAIPSNSQNEIELSIKQAKPNPNQPQPGESNLMVLVATWKIGNLTFQYLQFRDVATRTGTRRLVVASLGNLPKTPIPLLGDVVQPFDAIIFQWAQAENAKGLALGEVEKVNEILKQMGKPLVQYKILDKEEQIKLTTVAVLNGFHFMVVATTTRGQSEVILDYAFSQAKDGDSKAPKAGDDENPGSRMVPLQKAMGVFSIKNIGLRYSTGPNKDRSILSIRLDASVMVGPISFSVLGLSINLDFADNEGTEERYSLHNLPTPYPSLEGLETSFDKPPIQIGGALQLRETPEATEYAGALVISYMPWLFQAAGYYGETKSPTQFETMFVYCILKGPLITLQFASIEGICGGFGYNSYLKFPDAKTVIDFPLISSQPSGDGPLDALQTLLQGGWFFRQERSFWVAAGLTVKAFEILSVQAVIVIEWNPSIKLGIFALGTASIPGGKFPRQFAFVQLGIVASVDFETGVLKIEGELTPSSYILDPSCHLTGGFALYSWFDSNDPSLRGDWVFSIGGYHPAYKKPPQYPEPSRLGISWQLGKSLSISGQAYFAITPKTCMGGGRLDVQLSLNPLYAYFNAFVDFLINYKPFYFIAEGGVSVGVKFTLDLWIVTIKISIQIGARLYIRGPPIQGTVHVDFWVFGFDIDFGASSVPEADPLPIEDFIDLVCQAHTPGASAFRTGQVAADDGRKEHVFSIEEGLVPENEIESTPSGDFWLVNPSGFIFSIACKFVVQDAVVVTKTYGGETRDGKRLGDDRTPVKAKPMHANNIKSSLTVTIQHTEATLRYEDDDFPDPTWDDYEAVYTDVPEALWGEYNSNNDPAKNRNPSALLNGTSQKTLRHMTGIRIANPLPKCSCDNTIAYEIALFQIGELGPFPLPHTITRDETFEGDNPKDAEQWGRVKAKWETPVIGSDAGQTTVNLWTDVLATKMGWDEDRIKAGQKSSLSGAKPQHLIDDITKYYLWAPALSKA